MEKEIVSIHSVRKMPYIPEHKIPCKTPSDPERLGEGQEGLIIVPIIVTASALRCSGRVSIEQNIFFRVNIRLRTRGRASIRNETKILTSRREVCTCKVSKTGDMNATPVWSVRIIARWHAFSTADGQGNSFHLRNEINPPCVP